GLALQDRPRLRRDLPRTRAGLQQRHVIETQLRDVRVTPLLERRGRQRRLLVYLPRTQPPLPQPVRRARGPRLRGPAVNRGGHAFDGHRHPCLHQGDRAPTGPARIGHAADPYPADAREHPPAARTRSAPAPGSWFMGASGHAPESGPHPSTQRARPIRPRQPTLPSISNSISRFSSTAYSSGSSFATGSMNPRTTIAVASSSDRPRLIR